MRPKIKNYEFFISDKDRAKTKKLLKDQGIKDNEDFIVLNPGGNWDLKRWPVKNFAMLGDNIDIKVVLMIHPCFVVESLIRIILFQKI